MKYSLRHFFFAVLSLFLLLPVSLYAQSSGTIVSAPGRFLRMLYYIKPKDTLSRVSLMANIALLIIALTLYLVTQHHSRVLEKKVKQRSAELKKSQSRYHNLFENATDLIQSVDKSGRFLVVNKMWKQMLGYTDREIARLTFRDIIKKEELEKYEDIWKNLLANKGATGVHTIFVSKDGEEINVEGNINIDSNDGEFVATLGIFRDITDRIKKEQKEREFEMLKSRFITALSHVTRTPLNAIRWNLEMVINEDFGKVKNDQKMLLRRALESEGLVLRLIKNINMILDVERGTMKLNRAPTAVTSLVFSVVKSFDDVIKLKKFKLKTIKPRKKLSAIKMDPEKVRLVFEIMLDNSIRYTKQGGNITVRVSQVKGGVKITISDTGIGIPEAEQNNIFDRFFRASNATSMHADGVGIGLYLAESIVHAHGGKMGFKSTEGKGSEFWVKLPMKG